MYNNNKPACECANDIPISNIIQDAAANPPSPSRLQGSNHEVDPKHTPLKTNMSPENQWLEDVFTT